LSKHITKGGEHFIKSQSLLFYHTKFTIYISTKYISNFEETLTYLCLTANIQETVQ